jgi:hypothetical protein
MNNKLKTRSDKKEKLPQTGKLSAPESGHSIDEIRLLEHISSPFRWELVDIPTAQEESMPVKKYRHQKSVFRK